MGRSLIVIGGGISGLGVALEAQRRGCEVTLLERGMIGAATSANSLRIIHGGFRYLQKLDIPRVLQSARDQADLIARYPSHIRRISCLMPLARWGLRSAISIRTALGLYRLLLKFAGIKSNVEGGVLDQQQAEAKSAILRGLVSQGAFCWTDAMVLWPTEFHAELKSELSASGVLIREHVQVTEVGRRGSEYDVRVIDGGSASTIKSDLVVNTAGPWVNSISTPLAKAGTRGPLWCKAFNLVLRQQFEDKFAIGLHSPEGRLYFITPRANHSVVGTFYLPFSGAAESARVLPQEIEQALIGLSQALPSVRVTPDDVISVDCGVLPMKQMGLLGPELYGSEKVSIQHGYAEVISTKYTTFQSQARRVLNALGV